MMSRQETYKKALSMQVQVQAISLLSQWLSSPAKTLEEKLKDPNSVESKLLATIVAVVAMRHWIDGLTAKAVAEMNFIAKMLAKSAQNEHRSTLRPKPESRLENQEEEENQPFGLLALQDRLTTVKAHIQDLRNYQSQLSSQHKNMLFQLGEAHKQEMADALKDFGIVANATQLDQFHELNKHKIAPLFVDKLMASYEATHKENAMKGIPTSPLPPREQLVARQAQVQNVAWESAFVAVVADAYKNNSDNAAAGDSIKKALQILPLMRGLVADQAGALEKMDAFFAEKNRQTENSINNLDNQKKQLETAVHKFRASLIPSSNKNANQNKEEEEEKQQSLSPGRKI